MARNILFDRAVVNDTRVTCFCFSSLDWSQILLNHLAVDSKNFKHILKSLEVCNSFLESWLAENMRSLLQLPFDLGARALDLHEFDEFWDISTLFLVFKDQLSEPDLIADIV